MELYELPKIVRKRKRIGRGDSSGWGTTAGRGNKGEKSRSGGAKGEYFEGGQTPIIRRLPKRGFANIFRVDYEVINLSKLSQFFNDGDAIDIETLKEKGLVKRGKPVKILGDGEIDKKITIKAHAFSKSAKEKIENAGGSIEVLQ
jgi:large subunit ribosomal protein L15